MSELTLQAARVITADALLAPGWLRIRDGMIAEVGAGTAPARTASTGEGTGRGGELRDLGDATLVPGFVDLHCHGGGGGAYSDGVESARIARAAHLAHGTTSTMASLVTDSRERLVEQVTALVPLVEAGELGGIHLEGPWLSARRKGAHAEALLRSPDEAEIRELLAAGTYTHPESGEPAQGIRMVTIAPELPGALDAVRTFVAAGVLAAVGHTDADTTMTDRAIQAGATVATHLFNAMRPMHHREPGPVLPLMRDARVALELVADGTHLHPELPLWAEEAVGADRAVYVTDAMAAAAFADGDYRLGALDVEVRGGVARVSGTETIAGSTATMDELFRGRVLAASADGSRKDAALITAAKLTSTNPARVAGWSDVGEIAVGKRADLVALDSHLVVEHVFLNGQRVSEEKPRRSC